MSWVATLPHNEDNVVWLLQLFYPCRCRRSRGPHLGDGLVRGKHPSGEMLCPNWGALGRGCGRDHKTKPCQEKLCVPSPRRARQCSGVSFLQHLMSTVGLFSAALLTEVSSWSCSLKRYKMAGSIQYWDLGT